MLQARILLSLALVPSAPMAAQTKPSVDEPIKLIVPIGNGGISLPASLQLESITLHDGGHRPVAQLSDQSSGVVVSYILFPNYPDTPSGAGCRHDVLNGLQASFGKYMNTLQQTGGDDNSSRATASYFIDAYQGEIVRQQNVFAFYGDATVCAEIHLSKSNYKPADDALFKSLLDAFHPDLSYKPTYKDYFLLANILFKQDPGAAAPYYRAVLATVPANSETLKSRRIVTDQLAMALGMSGQLKESRAVLESAIAADPDYPLNYYNLACADAEQHDAKSASQHLQQAFDRKSNVIPGENLPIPTQDDSLLKLKDDKSFWTLAKSLSTQ